MDNLPEKLQNYLTEQLTEGSDVFSYNDIQCDGYTWIVIPRTLKEWVVLVQWYPGENDYQLINLQGRTLKFVKDLQVNQ